MGTTLDHGILNLPLDKRGAGSLDRQIDRNLKRIEAEKEAERRQAIAANQERYKRVPFTRDELEAARAIRTSSGWHRVVKVNTKSVTVSTGYSWNDRYELDKVLEVKA